MVTCRMEKHMEKHLSVLIGTHRRWVNRIIQALRQQTLVPLRVGLRQTSLPGAVVLVPRHVAKEQVRQVMDTLIVATRPIQAPAWTPARLLREAINVNLDDSEQI